MKKTHLCMVALLTSVTAHAQSDVQLSGVADVYVGSMKMAGAAKRDSLVGSGGMTTSWWGMKASEDLGGGLKAEVLLNGFLRMTDGASGRFNGDNMFSRDASLTLSGGFGAVTMGRAAAPNFLPSVFFNPLGDSFGFSPLIIHNNVNLINPNRFTRNNSSDTGWSSQLRYSTPTVAGLRGSVSYQLSGIAGKKNVGGNLFYNNGPVGLTAYYEQNELTNPNAAAFTDGSTRDAWMVGGSYDAKVVKGFATVGEADLSATVSQKTYTLGASVPFGTSGKFLLAYANSNPTAGNTRQTFTAGYDHQLSKRTDVYAMVLNDRIETLSSGTSFAVGVRHRF